MYGFLLSARSTKLFYKLARERATYRHRRKIAIERLARLDYIQISGAHLSITKSGQNALGKAVSNTFALLKKATWDHKWRIVVFDIPEDDKLLRNRVRNILKRAGFFRLQQSVWVFPHECNELVQLIKTESGLSKYILYGVLDRIENEDRLRQHFRLNP